MTAAITAAMTGRVQHTTTALNHTQKAERETTKPTLTPAGERKRSFSEEKAASRSPGAPCKAQPPSRASSQL